jgi:hypothetical protein
VKKSKKKFEVVIESYGIYTQWRSNDRELPKIVEFTNVIRAYEGNEFGMILRIRRGKGVKLDYYVKRPVIQKGGNFIENDFGGKHIVRSNDYKFFVGDCIDPPVKEKLGEWIISIYSEGILLAEKTFKVVMT